MAVKTQDIFDLPLQKTLRFLWDADMETRKKMSPQLTDYRIIQEFSPTMRVIRMRMNLPFPMSSRESLLCLGYKTDSDGAVYYGCSVEHPGSPADPNFLRAISLIMFAQLKPVPGDPQKTHVTSIGHADPKGWVPAWLANWLIKMQANEVVKMKQVAATWVPT
eukprot:TRINITY_DN1487_c0_g1_i4.p1 TRINITY_DN1487_c0_g1~~TRINITY_DN1487_c0_g1_i4.p1  ORF type:complete len:163 (+),score=28.46 TRINITY_DN1487_c0_g1_i4:43-531(+)